MDLILGIDGGGTRTRAALATPDGCIQFLGTAGPSNPNYAGFDAALRELRSAFDDALSSARRAGHAEIRFHGAFAGVAGAANESNRGKLQAALAAWPELADCTPAVDHDLAIACAGAHAGQPGIVIIAGTGSAAFGINASGQTARVGGWGALIDDVGGAFWLAVEALRAIARAHDGRLAPTTLSAPLLAALQISEINSLGSHLAAADMTRERLAGLAPLVIEAASAGDAAARSIVTNGARELALLASTVAQSLFPDRVCRIAVLGGTARAEFYMNALRSELAAVNPFATVEAPLAEPVQGAVLLALPSR